MGASFPTGSGYLFEEDILTTEAVQTTNSQLGCVEMVPYRCQKVKTASELSMGFLNRGLQFRSLISWMEMVYVQM